MSVFVIDWTTIGWAPPTLTSPTRTVTVCRLELYATSYPQMLPKKVSVRASVRYRVSGDD